MSKKKNIKNYAVCFLALNLAMEPIAGMSLFRPSAIMALNQEVTTESEKPYLISMAKDVTTSSINGDATGQKAIDGDTTSRWESSWGLGDQGTDEIDEWIKIDLGKVSNIIKVHLNWEGAYASKYQIQISDDDSSWETIKDVQNGQSGIIDFDFSEINARYIRIHCSEKALIAYGVSLFEFQVYGFNGLYKVNLAQNKPVEASSFLDEWWMKDENGAIKPGETPDAKNAVDGNVATRWRSSNDSAGFQEGTGQWIKVDLEAVYKVGKVNLTWDGAAAATVYDIQTSVDGIEWTTVHRELQGNETPQKIRLTATCRYIRLLYRSKYRESYVALREFEVFRQMEDEEDVVNHIPDLPRREVVAVPDSKATYNSNDIYFANQARYPEYIEDNLKDKPLASNDWWQSLVISEMGNALSVLPLKVKYETSKGLGMLTFGKSVWNKADDYTQGAVTGTKSESKMAFYVKPSDYDDSKVYNKVSGYGDYHVSVNLYDANGLAMANTIVKGSPYTYFEFNNKKEVEINLNNEVIGTFFDDNGNVLINVGDKVISDHLGLKTQDNDKINYYCLNLPDRTEFIKTDTGVKIVITGEQAYMSIATMSDKNQLDNFYKHGYAFVTDTEVTYDFNEDTSKITSSYNLSTALKAEGFSKESYQTLLPHQWDKYSSMQDLSKLNITYDSPRGSLRLYEGNSFSMTDTFYGMVPEFTMPTNDEYSEEELLSYLKKLDDGTQGNLVGSDAYWQGKSLHPLGLGVLVADQIGNTDYRDSYLAKIKTILTDWLTYSGGDDEAFFFYDQNWGTLYYKDSEFGANKDISDHHFTYGYFVFACSVLATYDNEFYEDYKEMIDLIVRDYASYDENDDMFCKLRSFDPYEGHSWAGGYADNDDGNNQEAGSESLFGWVGAYLWSIKREDKTMRDTAIFGFTTELNAIEHYWFNYYENVNDGFDHSGWPEDWPSEIIGQTYGSSYFYGTFFGGYPTYIYGIHWCPVAEYISYYGMDPELASKIYQGVLDDTEGQKKAHPEVEDYPDTLNSWQHIFLPFLSLSNADGALDELNPNTQSQSEGFNTYWFLNNMKDLGQKSSDIYATGGVSSSVYEKVVEGKKVYSAMVWNPTDHEIEVKFKHSKGEQVGNATIGANSFLRLDPTQKDAIQTQKPEFSIDSDIYDNTQYVKITTDTKDATIHYTTNGTVPTANSPVYQGRIVVTESTTIKAIAIKDDYINSSMSSIKVTIDTNSITTGTNLARGKTAIASSERGNVAGNATDYNAKTRWEATSKDDQWIYVDLGQEYNVNKVKISWEAAFAKGYEIQVSNDKSSWESVISEDNGDGNFDELIFNPTKGRYVRIKCNQPGTDYTYSIYEIGVYEARQISEPQLSLAPGTYQGNQLLSIASGTKGVEFRYTLDGSEPTEESNLSIPGITLYENTNIKIKAFKTGMVPSKTVSASYVITGGKNPGDVDNYDQACNFSVDEDAEIEEELLAGEGSNSDVNKLIEGNLAYGKEVIVSSSENDESKQLITDGNLDTAWSSNFANVENPDSQDCYIDLGSSVEFNQVKLHWVENTTPGNKYAIQVSDDGATWRTVYLYSHSTNNGDEAMDICNFDNVKARYIKMQGIKRGQGYGYAIKEMEVRKVDETQPFGQNVAINTIVNSASSLTDIDLIHDGKLDTGVTLNGVSTYQLDLSKTYSIDRIVLNHQDASNGKYVVSYSSDGETWNEIKTVNSLTNKDEICFEEVDAKYIKVEYNLSNSLIVQEIQIYTVGSSSEAIANEMVYEAKSATASTETDDKAENVLTDGRGNRWQAEITDTNEWIYLDLGESKQVNKVTFDWEGAYASKYIVQVSNDGTDWQNVYTNNEGKGGPETVQFDTVNAQYVRMYCVERAIGYGSSLYSMKVSYVEPIELEGILVGPAFNKVALKGKLQLQYAFYPANASNQKISFESLDESIATVDGNGLVVAKKLGETQIKATAGDKTSTVTIKVTGNLNKPTVKAEKIDDSMAKVTWNAIDLASYYDVFVADKSDGEYKKLNQEPIVDTQFIINNLEAGKYYFKVIARSESDQSDYLDSELSRTTKAITINSLAPTIILKDDSGMISVGNSLTIPVTITPDDVDVEWISSNQDIAIVENGVVTGVNPGKTTITIKVGEVTEEYRITVVKKLDSVKLDSQISQDKIVLSWNAVSGAKSYEVYRQNGNGEFKLVANSSDIEFEDTDLSVGAYNYKIIAKGDGDVYLDADESNSVSIVVRRQLNAVLATTKVDVNNVTISWDTVINASKYQVLRKNTEGEFVEIGQTDKTIYEDKALAVGEYEYQVIALGQDYYTNSNSSDSVKAVVKQLAVASVEPTIKIDASNVTIEWNSVDNATRYEVFRKDADGKFVSQAVISETEYKDENLKPGKYSYKIVAKGDGIYDDSADSETLEAIVIQRLSTVELNGEVLDDDVKLTWQNIENALAHEVYCQKDNGSFELIKIIDVKGMAKNYPIEYIDTDVKAGNYKYKVVAKGNEYHLDSTDSSIIDVTVKQQLSKVKPDISVDVNNVVINWKAVDNASSYKVLRDKGDGFEEVAIISQDTKYIDMNLSTGTYKYQVVAIGEGVYLDSQPSDIISAKVDQIGLASVISEILVAEDMVTVSWNEVEHADGYEVFRKINDSDYVSLGIVASNQYGDHLLSPGKYSYKIITKGSGDYSDSGASETEIIIINEQLGSVNVGAVVNGNEVQLEWDTVDHASGYDVYRQTGEGEFELIASIDKNQFIDRDLTAGNYNYQVVAKGDDVYLDSNASENIAILIEKKDDSKINDNQQTSNNQYNDLANSQTKDNEQVGQTSIKTSDSIDFTNIWLMGLSLMTVGLSIIKKRFKKINKQQKND